VDAIPLPRQTFTPKHEHEDDSDEAHTPKKRSSRQSKDLGWA
jgi:hypothetical protein